MLLALGGCSESSTGSGAEAPGEDAEIGESGDVFAEATLEIALLSPEPDTAVFHGALVTVEALVKESGWPVDSGTVEWSSSLDGVVAAHMISESGLVSGELFTLEVGVHTLTARAMTPDGQWGKASVSLSVVGNLTAPEVAIEPSSPTTADVLHAVIVTPSTHVGPGEVVYSTEWGVSGEPLPDALGDTLSPTQTHRGEEITVVVTPHVLGLAGPSDSAVTLILNSPPAAKGAVITPEQGGTTTAFECVAEGWGDLDGDSPVDGFRWELNDLVLTDEVGAQLPPLTAQRGDVIRCELTPGDGFDVGASIWSKPLIVGNASPSLEAAVITPDEGHAFTPFECVGVNPSDPDGDDVTVYHEWFLDGESVSVDTSLDGVAIQHGDTITCKATPWDGALMGESVESLPVVLGNAPPVGTTPSIVPASPTVLSTLSCEAAPPVDPDEDQANYLYMWFVEGVLVEGATSSTLVAPHFAKGQAVVCVVTPSDGMHLGAPMMSAPAVVLNSPPAGGEVILSPEAGTVLDTFACVPGGAEDPDGDAIDWSHSWKVNGVIASGTEILVAPTFVKGDSVVCEATPHDGEAVGSIAVSDTLVIGNALPVVGVVVLNPWLPEATSKLQCVAEDVYDPDGEEVSLAFSWTVNGEVVSAGTDILGAPAFKGGDSVVCVVAPSDGDAIGLSVSSNPVQILNTPPSLAGAVVTPSAPSVLDTVECDPLGWSDADGDPPGHVFAWLLDEQVIAGAQSATMPVPPGSRGSTLRCQVWPDDGKFVGESVTSDPVTVVNAPPKIGKVTLTPSVGNQNTLFTCIGALITDPDGDDVELSHGWLLNGAPIPAQQSVTLNGVAFPPGASLQCQITPYDGFDSGATVVSTPAILNNSAPSVGQVSIVPSNPTTVDDLTCETSNWADADGDLPGYFFNWSLAGAPASMVDPTIPASETSRGETWQCSVIPFDGLDVGDSVASQPVVIANSVPTVAAVQVSPPEGTLVTSFACEPSGWFDADGDPPSYDVVWMIDGVVQPGSNAEAFVPVNGAIGEFVSCLLIPLDGIIQGDSVLSGNAAKLVNAPPTVSLLEPSALQYGSGDLVFLQATVDDLEDGPGDLLVVWESSVDGLLASGGSDVTGFSAHSIGGLTPGQHTISAIVTDSAGGSGVDIAVIVVGFLCGEVSEPPDLSPTSWGTGFEAGNLSEWNYASYNTFVTEDLFLGNCGFDEYGISEDAALTGDLGLFLTPDGDDFMLIKLFGAPVETASVESWIRMPGGNGLRLGFVQGPSGGNPPSFVATTFLSVANASTLFVYDNGVPAKSNPIPKDTWARVRIVHDGPSESFTLYVNDVFAFMLPVPGGPSVDGFTIGAWDTPGAGPALLVDDVSYVVSFAP